jgi:threonine synthase
VGIAAAESAFDSGLPKEAQVIVLSTAHPGKFSETVFRATGRHPDLPERLAACLTRPRQAVSIGKTFTELSGYLLDSFS